MKDTDIIAAIAPDAVSLMDKAIAEIKRLRQENATLTAEHDALRAERDEARLLAIALQVQQQHESGHPNYLKETEWQTGRRIARERGWDCFKEEP